MRHYAAKQSDPSPHNKGSRIRIEYPIAHPAGHRFGMSDERVYVEDADIHGYQDD